MKKILVFCFITVLMFSCGSKKAVTKKKSSTNTNTERVVVKKQPKTISKEAEEKEIVNGVEVKIGSTEDYIKLFKTIAQEEMQLYGIPASITLAQGILESNSGKGRLAVEGNNHFGIKCHEWTGDKIYHDDDASQECFRKYNDSKYSFRDHSLFLSQRSRYAALFKLKKEDYKGWAKELRRAGYATDTKYPDKLIGLIERYELYKYDQEVLGDKYVKYEAEIGDFSMYYVEKGDSMYAISKKFNISVSELQELNGLSGTMLSVGQKLKVKGVSNQSEVKENQVKAAKKQSHVVVKGDTLYSISKKYNISIQELQKLNSLTNTALNIGQILQVN